MEMLNLPLEFQTLLTNLITAGKCACHFLNPHKTRILMWAKIEGGQTTYYLRIGIQKFIAQAQVDRNGETYWRYWIYEEKKVEAKPEVITPSQEELNQHAVSHPNPSSG